MKPIEFLEQTEIIAKNQPEYLPFPVYRNPNTKEGEIIACWQLSFKERFKLLFTGKIWHHVLTFGKSLQPQYLRVDRPFRR